MKVYFKTSKRTLSISSVNNATRSPNNRKNARNVRLYSAKNANAKIATAMNLKSSTAS